MRVLSLFDGMSVGRVALERCDITPSVYHASEIDKYATTVSQRNWPSIDRLGNVCDWPLWHHFRGVENIDLLMAGSPCQGFSFAGKGLAFDDPRSKLYFEFLNCIREFKPKWVMLENVVMKAEWQDVISETMQAALDSYGGGTLQKTKINSALVCAQNRKRIYWTNWPVCQPEDRGILLRDVLLDDGQAINQKANPLLTNCGKSANSGDVDRFLNKSAGNYVYELGALGSDASKYDGKGQLNPEYKSQCNTVMSPNGKSQTLCAGTKGYVNGHIDLSELAVDASKYEHLIGKDVKPGGVVGYRNGVKGQSGRVRNIDGKAQTLCANGSKGSGVPHNGMYLIDDYNQRVKTDGKSCTLTPNSGSSAFRNGQKVVEFQHVVRRDGKYSERGDKSMCLTAGYSTGVKDRGQMTLIKTGRRIRKLHPVECERLQTLSDNYTEGVSNTQRYKMLGNGWNAETIAHILRCNTSLSQTNKG